MSLAITLDDTVTKLSYHVKNYVLVNAPINFQQVIKCQLSQSLYLTHKG